MIPTPKQKRAVKELVENGGTETLGKTLKKVGYKENTAHTPQKVTESKGFKQAMEEAGLTDEFLNKCLSYDIKAKPKNRLGEVTLAHKLKGNLTEKTQTTIIAPKPLLDSLLDDNGQLKNTDEATQAPESDDNTKDE